MGIFYNPPQPPTANNAGTPPEPHVPIGNQGTSVPPRRAVAFAATMAILVAAWPADLEPRLQRPNDQQTKIAPLTRVYGQQPPVNPPLTVTEFGKIYRTWIETWDTQRVRTRIPATFGAPPSPQPALTVTELEKIRRAWTETWDAQRAPNSTAWLAPLSPYLAHTPLPSLIWDAWIPPPPLPARPAQIAPLTLTYGAQPAPQPPLSTLELAQIHRTWVETWDTQTAPKSAAWNVPPIVQAFVPASRFRYDILSANQDPVTIAFVQSYVVSQSSSDDPPRQFALSLANQAITQQAWIPAPLAPPQPRPTAAWNIPPIPVRVPYTPPPALIWTAWVEPFVRPPAPVSIAPLTLVYGTRPPVQAPLSAASRIILAAWPADLEPRLGRPNAERVRIAPLTLVYGNPPTPHGSVSPAQMRLFTLAWEPPWHIAAFYLHGNYVPGSFVPPPPPTGVAIFVADTAVTLIDVSDDEVTTLTVTDVLLFPS